MTLDEPPYARESDSEMLDLWLRRPTPPSLGVASVSVVMNGDRCASSVVTIMSTPFTWPTHQHSHLHQSQYYSLRLPLENCPRSRIEVSLTMFPTETQTISMTSYLDLQANVSIHMQKVKVKGHSKVKTDWQTERQTDGSDCITCVLIRSVTTTSTPKNEATNHGI